MYLSPILKNINNWGPGDWDQHFFYNEVARKTILEFHQFPLWNPYYCGGNVMLANVQSGFLTPFFIPILLFGTVIGIKIQILIYFFTGLWGVFFLSKKIGCKGIACYFPPVVYMFCSYFALMIHEGHTTYFQMALIPWVLLFYIKSKEDIKNIIPCAIFLSLIGLGGAYFLFPLTILMIIIHILIDVFEILFVGTKNKEKKDIMFLNLGKLILIGVLIISLTFLIGAVKFIPNIEFIKEYPRLTGSEEFFDYNNLYNILIDRDQTPWETKGQYWLWHEYGTYVGIVPVLLLIFSLKYFKKNWKLFLSAAFFLFLSIGSHAPFNIWGLLQKLPIYSSQHVPSRNMIFFVLYLSLLAGFGLTQISLSIENKFLKNLKKHTRILIVVSILISLYILLIVDYSLVNKTSLEKTFILKEQPIKENKEYAQLFDIGRYGAYSSMFPTVLSNVGLISCYEHQRVRGIAEITWEDECNNLEVWRVSEVFKDAGNRIKSEETEDAMNYFKNESNTKIIIPEIASLNCDLLFDFTKKIRHNEQCAVYVFTYVYSEQYISSYLGVGSDDGVTVWINDEIVWNNNIERSGGVAEDRFEVKLKEGWNKIMVRTYNNYGGWKLFFGNFEEGQGNKIKNIVYHPFMHQNIERGKIPKKRDVYFINEENIVKNIEFTPNVIKADIEVINKDRAVLNQNLYNGWKAKIDGKPRKVSQYKDSVSVEVTPEDENIVFYYLPTSFLIGLFISTISIIVICTLYFRNTKRSSQKSKKVRNKK